MREQIWLDFGAGRLKAGMQLNSSEIQTCQAVTNAHRSDVTEAKHGLQLPVSTRLELVRQTRARRLVRQKQNL